MSQIRSLRSGTLTTFPGFDIFGRRFRISALAQFDADTEQMTRLVAERDEATAAHERVTAQSNAYRARLDRIIAAETPGCAHIGKRMVALARGQA